MRDDEFDIKYRCFTQTDMNILSLGVDRKKV